MRKYKLDLPLLLPEMEKRDACAQLLVDRLRNVRGVEEAHVVRENGTAGLCLHYDPNLVSLGRLRRIAESTGAEVTDRYRHERMPFAGLDAADTAETLASRLEALPGMLHAGVNYAAGMIFVAYDSQVLDRATIQKAISGMGARVVGPTFVQGHDGVVVLPASEPGDVSVAARTGAVPGEARERTHDHGSAPGFLPHSMQER